MLRAAVCLFLTALCSLLTAHCSLPIAHCSLLTAHYSLLTAHCSLPASPSRCVGTFQGACDAVPPQEVEVWVNGIGEAFSSLRHVDYLLTTYYLLRATYYLLPTAYCLLLSLRLVDYLLLAAYCLLLTSEPQARGRSYLLLDYQGDQRRWKLGDQL